MKKIDQNNSLQVESLINECKGNLFEFLVAQNLAKNENSEGEFLISIPLDYKNRLKFYEEVIRTFDQNLLKNLIDMSVHTSKAISDYHLFSDKTCKYDFKVIGKMVATNDNSLWNETDIVASQSKDDNLLGRLFISLKLSKDHSFTNTKSAGVKSFIEKYFSNFGALAIDSQKAFSAEVDESYHVMGHALYKQIDQDFFGTFDSRWTNYHTELPGELSEPMRKVVLLNYNRVCIKLRSLLVDLYEQDADKFYHSLFALCGFGNKDIIQVQCYHQKGEFKEVYISSLLDFFTLNKNEVKIKEISDLGSSFDIEFEKFSLQVRIKPMNKFTTAAYKVNCSIKKKIK